MKGKPKNKDEPKNKGGRPPLYNSPEELDELIQKYFEDCERRERPPTIAGLAYWLEIDRQTIYNYSNKDKFFGTIKKARDRIIMNIEEELITRGNGGTVFLAKNYGYTDRQEIDHSGNLQTVVNIIPASKVKNNG